MNAESALAVELAVLVSQLMNAESENDEHEDPPAKLLWGLLFQRRFAWANPKVRMSVGATALNLAVCYHRDTVSCSVVIAHDRDEKCIGKCRGRLLAHDSGWKLCWKVQGRLSNGSLASFTQDTKSVATQ